MASRSLQLTRSDREYRREKVVRFCQAGASPQQAAERFGLSVWYVRKILIGDHERVAKKYRNDPHYRLACINRDRARRGAEPIASLADAQIHQSSTGSRGG